MLSSVFTLGAICLMNNLVVIHAQISKIKVRIKDVMNDSTTAIFYAVENRMQKHRKLQF